MWSAGTKMFVKSKVGIIAQSKVSFTCLLEVPLSRCGTRPPLCDRLEKQRWPSS